jgi:hypothetical protein
MEDSRIQQLLIEADRPLDLRYGNRKMRQAKGRDHARTF